MTQADIFPAEATAKAAYATADRNGNSGQQRKKRGQDQVLQREADEWKERALYLLKVYVAGLGKGAVFAFEDARVYMQLKCGLPDPHTHHVWGAFPSVAKAAGLPIEMTDRTRPANSPKTNGHRVSLWRVNA